MKWDIDELIQAVQARLISKKERGFNQVSIDTRDKDSLVQGAFFAIKGDRDGHDYLKRAVPSANVLVVESLEGIEEFKDQVTILQVSNTVQALQDWAVYWRNKLKLKTAVVTGSNGKTSTKHFCKILFQDDPSVLVSPKSYNNYLGVPLSVLKADSTTRVLIQEIGTSQKGEIQKLCHIVQPDVAVCTMVGFSHIQGLETLEEVSREKEQVYIQNVKRGTAIFNLDNSWTAGMKSRYQGSILTFSAQDKRADIFLQVSEAGENFLVVKGCIQGEKGESRISLSGQHHLTNIMSAVGLALALGQQPGDIWRKLSFLTSPEGRFQWMKVGQKKILFDAYNSNPQSMEAFLDYLSSCQDSFVLCIGDMLDLGVRSSEFHRQLGRKTAQIKADYVFFIGQYRFDFENGLKDMKVCTNYELYETFQKGLGLKILSVLKPSSRLALKASRNLKLERVLKEIKDLERNEKKNEGVL